jgi:hypothetical protein
MKYAELDLISSHRIVDNFILSSASIVVPSSVMHVFCAPNSCRSLHFG